MAGKRLAQSIPMTGQLEAAKTDDFLRSNRPLDISAISQVYVN